MAEPVKKKSIFESLQEQSEEYDRKNPIIKTQYAVVEKQKDWYDSHWEVNHEGTRLSVWVFDTDAARATWLARMEPSAGNEFILEIHETRRLTHIKVFTRRERGISNTRGS